MSSSIDPTKPIDHVPAAKADLRANFQAAKDEIEALQAIKFEPGQALDMQDAVLNRPELKDYAETMSAPDIAAGTLTLDLEAGNVFEVLVDRNVTSLALANAPASGRAGWVTLILRQDANGGRTVAWPAAVKWSGGQAPMVSLSAGAIDVYRLLTVDGGATWLGFCVGQDFASPSEYITTPEAHGWSAGNTIAENTSALLAALADASANASSSESGRGVVELRPSTHYELTAPTQNPLREDTNGIVEIVNYPNAELRTQGQPTDNTRAIISHEPVTNRTNVSLFHSRSDSDTDLNFVLSHVRLDGRKDEWDWSGLTESDLREAGNNGSIALIFIQGSRGLTFRHIEGFDGMVDGFCLENVISSAYAFEDDSCRDILFEDCDFHHNRRGCAIISAGVSGGGYDQVVFRRVKVRFSGDDSRPGMPDGNLTATLDIEPIGTKTVEGVSWFDCESSDNRGARFTNWNGTELSRRNGRGFNFDFAGNGAFEKIKLVNCLSANNYGRGYNFYMRKASTINNLYMYNCTSLQDARGSKEANNTWFGSEDTPSVLTNVVLSNNTLPAVALDKSLADAGHSVDIYGTTHGSVYANGRAAVADHGSASPPVLPGLQA